MSKKKIRGLSAFDVLEDNNADDGGLASLELDAQIYGAVGKADTHRQSASPVAIADIHPDPAQPRRAIPHKVREVALQQGWNGQMSERDGLFAIWQELVHEERGNNSFSLASYLNQTDIGKEEDADRPETIGPIEATLVTLIELATSIRKDGLTNPITVVQKGLNEYQLETGERRWLAYQLLDWHTDDDEFSKVSARIVENLNIWRQAAENNARANLNAISKARQFAVLLMDLLSTESNMTFTSRYEFQHEQGYYSQVADGTDTKLRIPRGKSERLLNATGLKSRKQLREYRALLRLPLSVWEIADDLNWSERFLRDLVSEAHGDEDYLTELAIFEARKQGYTVPVGTVSTKRPRKATEKKASSTVDFSPSDKRYYAGFLRTLTKAKKGKAEARDTALNQIDEIRRWLEEEENRLRNK
ncbi:MAG: hypothetical protein Phog2KO_11130 [Phototrophicaceae bacterium]